MKSHSLLPSILVYEIETDAALEETKDILDSNPMRIHRILLKSSFTNSSKTSLTPLSSFSSTIHGISSDTGRFAKALAESVIYFSDNIAAFTRLLVTQRQLNNRRTAKELFRNPKQLALILYDLGKILSLASEPRSCLNKYIAKRCIDLVEGLLPDFWYYYGYSLRDLNQIFSDALEKLEYTEKWSTNFQIAHFLSARMRFVTHSIELEYQNSDPTSLNYFLMNLQIVSSEQLIQALYQIDKEDQFLDAFLIALGNWIRSKFKNHELCYLYYFMSKLLGAPKSCHLADLHPPEVEKSSNLCVLGIENTVHCGTLNFEFTDSQNLSTNLEVTCLFHKIRSMKYVSPIALTLDEIACVCSMKPIKDHFIYNGIEDELLAFFPTANGDQRWRFKEACSLHDSYEAMKTLVEVLHVITWDDFLYRTLVWGQSMNSNNADMPYFDTSIYCWALSFVFYCYKKDCPTRNGSGLRVIDSWLECDEAFASLLAFADFDTTEYEVIENWYTYKGINKRNLYLELQFDADFSWTRKCDGTIEDINEFKIVLRRWLVANAMSIRA